MRKQPNRIDLEFQKPVASFIEKFRMRVSGNNPEYTIEDKIEKKVKRNREDEDEDGDGDYDVENAQVVDATGEKEGFDIAKFRPTFQSKKVDPAASKEAGDQGQKPRGSYAKPKPQKIGEIIKKLNKPTVLSFDDD